LKTRCVSPEGPESVASKRIEYGNYDM